MLGGDLINHSLGRLDQNGLFFNEFNQKVVEHEEGLVLHIGYIILDVEINLVNTWVGQAEDLWIYLLAVLDGLIGSLKLNLLDDVGVLLTDQAPFSKEVKLGVNSINNQKCIGIVRLDLEDLVEENAWNFELSVAESSLLDIESSEFK